jgi:uracil-DNA glycosylase
LLGAEFRVTQQRGKLYERGERAPILATVHPSSILRSPTPQERDAAYQAFVADLAKASERIHQKR